MLANTRHLRTKEAALLLVVSVETLRRRVNAERIRAVKLPSGDLRIPESEVVRILQKSKMVRWGHTDSSK